MATAPLGADSAPVTHPRNIPPAPAVMAILDRFNRNELGHTIEVLVALLDIWDGEPDLEDDDPAEAAGDEKDAAWVEWHTMRGSQKRGPNVAQQNEDDEEDDPAGIADEDGANTGIVSFGWGGPVGAGCPISDPGGCEHDGREEEHDMEREQMANDVPALPVYSIDFDPLTDKRSSLGLSNLQSTFVGEARSADTGALHVGHMQALAMPGVPV